MSDGFFGIDYGRPEPGTDTSQAQTFDDVLKADSQPVPWQYADRGLHVPKPGPIPFSRYTDPAVVQQEVEHIWTKYWTVACREEDIPNVGDRIKYDIVQNSYMIVRAGPESFKAYYNSCPHRARSLCDGHESGEFIRCPFHGWRWDLEGKMTWLPSQHDFPHVKQEDYKLQEVRVGRWGGHVFINPDENAPPLEDCLGPLKTHFNDCPPEDRYTAAFVRKKFRANWKIIQEAFIEAYHMVETHWDAEPFSGDTATLYDCWEDGNVHVDRLTTPMAIPSGFFEAKVSPQGALEQFLAGNHIPGGVPEGRGSTIGDARSYAAEIKRDAMAEAFGMDLADKANVFLVDASRYFLWPNFHPWWGLGVPLWYRFLPDGANPDAGVMEIRVMLPVPAGGQRPAAAKPIELDFDDRCADVPALGFLGHVIDQDMANIERIQDGLKQAPRNRSFMTLARYQESSIAHFHEVWAKAVEGQ